MSKVISVCSSGGKSCYFIFYSLLFLLVENVIGYHIDINVVYELEFNSTFKYSNDHEKIN